MLRGASFAARKSGLNGTDQVLGLPEKGLGRFGCRGHQAYITPSGHTPATGANRYSIRRAKAGRLGNLPGKQDGINNQALAIFNRSRLSRTSAGFDVELLLRKYANYLGGESVDGPAGTGFSSDGRG